MSACVIICVCHHIFVYVCVFGYSYLPCFVCGIFCILHVLFVLHVLVYSECAVVLHAFWPLFGGMNHLRSCILYACMCVCVCVGSCMFMPACAASKPRLRTCRQAQSASPLCVNSICLSPACVYVLWTLQHGAAENATVS